DAYAELLVVALEGNLVVVDERPDLLRFHVAQAEVLEDRLRRFVVHPPVAVVGLRHAQLTAVEPGDHLLDALGVHSTSSRISAARLHSSSVGTSPSRQ